MLILFIIAALLLFIIAALGFSRDYFNPVGWGLAILTLGYLLLTLGVIGAAR